MSDYTPAEEEELAHLVGAIQDRMNSGETVDMDVLKAEHPRYAGDLDSYFSCESALQQAFGEEDSQLPGLEILAEEEATRLDLKAFPINRRLADCGLGTVYLLGSGTSDVPRELVVLRSWFKPRERTTIEQNVRHAMSFRGEGFVPIVDMGRLNQVPYVLREHFPGRSLSTLFEEIADCGGTLGMERAVHGEVGEGQDVSLREAALALSTNTDHMNVLLGAFAAWAQTLDQAHSRGLVHREIEPRNLLVDDKGHCAIGGAGLVWQGTGIEPNRMRDWRPQWLAPEVVDKAWGNVTWLADVYSLARGLAACLSLDLPGVVEDPEDVMMHIAVGDRTWMADLPEGLDPRLRELIEVATFPDPSRRLKNLGLFAQKITALIASDKGRGGNGWAARLFRRP